MPIHSCGQYCPIYNDELSKIPENLTCVQIWIHLRIELFAAAKNGGNTDLKIVKSIKLFKKDKICLKNPFKNMNIKIVKYMIVTIDFSHLGAYSE